MTALLEATNLTKHFPVNTGGLLRRRSMPLRAVDAVDLAIEEGETLGLVGESGCGKSTLGRLLIRLIPATAGQVRFLGIDILTLGQQALRRARRDMQIIFQDPFGALNPRMTVHDIIAEPLEIQGVPARLRHAEVATMLDKVGLPARASTSYPHEFS